MFRVHSVYSDRELMFSKKQGSKFDVEISGSNLRCLLSVWHDDSYPNVDEFFRELATLGKPWQGERKWESLEGDLKISATCSRTGNVHLFIEIDQNMGEDEESNIKAGLVIEFGQLDYIAKGIGELFNK